MSLKEKILLVISAVMLGFIFWNSRQVFFGRYEPEYMENLYYHSQWNIPQSPRGISDGLLYQFVGYRLVEGENPFNVNFEVPPLGKYLYGLSEWFTGNPYWVSIVLYLGSVLGLYFLAQDLFKKRELSLWTLVLFISAPFAATQIRDTMLDLPLMFFYLVHAMVFIRFLAKGNWWTLIIAGGFLGLATGVKFGAYTPLVIVVGGVVMLLKFRKWWQPLVYLAGTFGGYVLAWFCYFIRHPNPIPWARLHAKQFDFYFLPETTVDHLNQWRGIFGNTYQGWWQKEVMTLGDWSPLLPLGVIALAAVLTWAVRKREWGWLYLGLLGVSFLVINTFISFWPRYLMPVIPLMALALVQVFQKAKWFLVILILANLPFLYSGLAVKNVSGDVGAATRFIGTRNYRELYRSLPMSQRKEVEESIFIDTLENFLASIETRDVLVEVGPTAETSKQAEVKVKITYITQYGVLVNEPTLVFRQEHNLWRLDWSWDYVWPGLEPKSQVEVVNVGHIGLAAIKDGSGQTRAVRAPGKVVYAMTRVLSWPRDLDVLKKATAEDMIIMSGIIRRTIPDKYPRFMGYLDPALGEEAEKIALSAPGATFKEVEFLRPIGEPGKAFPLIRLAYQKHPEYFYQQAEVFLVLGESRQRLPLIRPEVKDVILTLIP